MPRFGEGDFFSPEDDEHRPEYEDEYDDEDDDEEMDSETFLSAIPADLVNQWKQSEIGIEDKKLNYVVLRQAVQMCEKSFLWSFRSFKTKVHMINAAYMAMLDLVKGEE